MTDAFENGVFGSSGVRGVYGDDITDELVVRLANAFAHHLGPAKTVCIGRDTRPSSPQLLDSFSTQLLRRGINVADLGVISTPGVYMLADALDFDAGIMVTASHNPPEYNGFKFCNRHGMAIDQTAVEANFFDPPSFSNIPRGTRDSIPGAQVYFDRLADICPSPKRPLRIVVDCACGPNSEPLPQFLRDRGHEVLQHNCRPDLSSIDRDPEPMPETLTSTIDFLHDNAAHLGLCFDGDNDRIVFLDRDGFLGFRRANAIMSIIALENANSGEIVGSVETGRYVEQAVEHAGGRLRRTVVGDAHIAAQVQKSGAVAGVEECGHYIMPQVGYFSSTVYAAMLLLARRDVNKIRDELEFIEPVFTREERIPCDEDEKRDIMSRVETNLLQWHGQITTIDGVRVDFDDAWILVRPSGTSPYMKVNAEASSQKRLDQLAKRGLNLVQEAKQ